ncbi:hypothetical protein BUALT_Bualt05G0125000 [Buddleja alternifolia]|uniref:Uncharacterized protein n=1 Tax=Buddleja alternifolia TaxID=168488 RepID=A0AAV6XS32_9LAMI|nr:hypothetical protein BUALT_Bualt05G0125000 [Buddleja alternifolia]
MATGTERSKALHNFTMPCGLRWGNQRFLRCMKVNSDGQISPLRRFTDNNSDSSDHHRQQQRTAGEKVKDLSGEFVHGSPKVGPTGRRRFYDDDDDDDGIAAMREKVMFDLQTAADKMKNAIFKDGHVSISPQPPPAAASAEGETNRPWNLRTRRAPSKTPVSVLFSGGGGKGLRVDVGRPNSGFAQTKVAAAAAAAAAMSNKLPIQRSGGGGAAASGVKRERAKFSVPLSKKEIEEDFMAMVGHRPPRRPKKRARTIQKQIDVMWIQASRFCLPKMVNCERWTNLVTNCTSIMNLEFEQSVEIPLSNTFSNCLDIENNNSVQTEDIDRIVEGYDPNTVDIELGNNNETNVVDNDKIPQYWDLEGDEDVNLDITWLETVSILTPAKINELRVRYTAFSTDFVRTLLQWYLHLV